MLSEIVSDQLRWGSSFRTILFSWVFISNGPERFICLYIGNNLKLNATFHQTGLKFIVANSEKRRETLILKSIVLMCQILRVFIYI